MVSVNYYTDPACPWSWGIEPQVRKLMLEFGDSLGWVFVMGGLGRDLSTEAGADQVYGRLIREWLIAADRTSMPIDPLLWVEGPIATSYPACMAVKAASHQAADGGYRYLRRVREGLMCERRKLDHVEALAEQARLAGLDVERFRLDLRSHGTTEAFAADLDRTTALASAAQESVTGEVSKGAGGAPLPTLVFGDGEGPSVVGPQPYQAFRLAAVAAGAAPVTDAVPTIEQLLDRFDTVSTREVEVVCELAGPRAPAELFRLAEQWQLRPVWRLTGYMWERA